MSDFREVSSSQHGLSDVSTAVSRMAIASALRERSVADLSSANPMHQVMRVNAVDDDENEDNHSHESRSGAGAVLGASMNFINSIVGAGIIGIPLAIQQCGFLLGITLLTLVAYFVKQSVMILIDCGMQRRIYNLEDLCEATLGTRGYYVAVAAMFLFAFGGQVAYLVILGDTLPLVAQFVSPQGHSLFHNREDSMIFLSITVVLPLSLMRDLSSLSWTSSLSILMDVILILVVLLACISTQSSNNDNEHSQQHFTASHVTDISASLFAGVGTMSFAFVCQHNSFLVFNSLTQPTIANWDKVSSISISVAYLLSIALGLIGFFAFYPFVQGDLLNNFPANSPYIAIARGLLAFSMLLTYPMELFVSRHCLFSLWNRYAMSWNSRHSQGRQRLSTDSVHSDSSHGKHFITADEEQEIELSAMHSHRIVDSENDQDQMVEIVLNGSLQDPMALTLESDTVDCVNDNESDDNAHHSDEHVPLSRHVSVTLLLWAVTLAIALVSKKLGVVSALTGAVAAATLGYTIPGLIHIHTYEMQHAQFLTRVKVLTQRLLRRCGLQSWIAVADREFVEDLDSFRELVADIRMFALSYVLICFGLCTVVIGVTTILLSDS